MSRLSYKTLFIILIFLLIPIIFLIRINQQGKDVYAEWFDDSWTYRQRVDITNPSGGDLTDFQVSVNIGTSALIAAGKMQSDCDDIRITDQGGNLLPYWIETNGINTCNQTSTKIWTKTASLPSSGATLYIYYSNPSATTVQNGKDVFIFFDDFNGGSIDTLKWTVTGSMLSLSGGRLRADRANGTGSIYAISTFSRPFILDMDYYPTQYPSGWEGAYHGTIAFGTFNNSTQTEHAWVPHGGGGNSYCGLCDDGGCYHGSYVNPLRIGNTLYNISMQIQTTIAGPQGVMSYSNIPNDGIGSSASNTVTTTAATGDNPLKIGVKDYGGNTSDDFEWDNWRVRQYASSNPTASITASEEVGGGPIAYWKFDEGVGTTLYDSSGQNKTGIFLSAPIWKTEDQCLSGKCLAFDNVDDGVSVTNENFTSLTDYTMCAWINPKGNHKNYAGTIISSGDWNNVHWSFQVNQNNTILQTRKPDGVNFPEWSYAFPLSQWTHVCLTRSSTLITAYVNGKQLGSAYTGTTGNLVSNAANTTIGRETYASGYFDFNGLIDEPKIYRYARSAAQIKQDYVTSGANTSFGSSSGKSLSDGLVGYWKMDEASGNLIDSSGNSANANDANTTVTSGKFGNSRQYNGTDAVNSVSLTNLPTSAGSKFTLSFWMNWNGNDTQMPFSFGSSSNFDLFYAGGGFGINTWNSDVWGIPTSGLANNWKHIVMVITNGNIKALEMYVDGVKQITSQITGSTIDGAVAANPFYIGSGPGSYYSNGKLDEVRIYNRALSPTEAKQLYEFAPGPVLYYNIEESSGTTIQDISGNSNNGTAISTSIVSGKYGKGRSLNTTGAQISFSAISTPPSWTAMAWAKFPLPTTTEGWRTLFSHNGGTYHQILVQNNGEIGTYSNAWYTSGFNINTLSAGWHHITAVGDGTTTAFFIDGIKRGTSAFKISTSDFSSLGNYSGGAGQWFGSVDDVKIYNYTRTQEQIIQDMQGAGSAVNTAKLAGPIAHYKFDEGQGSTLSNSGILGTSLNVSFMGGTSPSWSNNGKSNKALLFDGNSTTITKNNDSTLNMGTGGFSVFSWVKVSASSGPHDVFASKGAASIGDTGYWWGLSTTGKQDLFINTGGNFIINESLSNTRIDDNIWHHVGFTWQPSEGAKFWLDGKIDGSIGVTSTVNFQGSTNLYIGGIANYSGFSVNGLIDELKIYNYALTADEVKTDYNQSSTTVFGVTNLTVGNTSNSATYCVPGSTDPCSPPIAEWKFEEGVGTTAFDTTGNNNPATFGAGSSAPSWTTGKIGKALNFNGTSNYAYRTMSPNFSGDVTFDFWYYPRGNGYILDRNWGHITYYQQSSQQATFYCHNGATMVTNSATYNTWHHVTGICNSTAQTASLYIDSSPAINVGFTNPSLNSNPVTLGAVFMGQGGNFFNGSIDQFKIYNYARSSAQIAWDYNQGAPIAHWKLDECQGNIVHDSSGIGNTGTITIGGSGTQNTLGTCQVGTSAAWTNGATGKFNSSLNFDGSDDYISLPSISNPQNLITLSAWVKTNGGFSYGGIIGNSYTNIRLCKDHDRATGNEYSFDWNGQWDIGLGIPESVIEDNTWHLLTGVYDGSYMRIYLDGKEYDNYSYTGTIASPYTGLVIGRNYYSTNDFYYKGLIDDVRIYNYALTPQQIKQVYNGGAINFN